MDNMSWNKTPEEAARCADYILGWLENRNGGELAEALEKQRVGDRRLMRDELIHILRVGGKPDNWIK